MGSIGPVPPRAQPHPALRKLGKRVRQLREAKHWTQEYFAGECGLDRSFVSFIESGRQNPTYLTLLRMAKILEMSLPTLVDLDRTR